MSIFVIQAIAGSFNTNNFFIARTNKQPWASSLCHSRVPQTNVELLLRYKLSRDFNNLKENDCKNFQGQAHL